MSQDGICEVEPGLFSMTMAFTDVNFQIAMLEEQKNIFTKYSEFLNYFDPSLHLEINLVTRSMDEEQFRRDTFLPLRGNDRDRYAEEMNQVVAEKALRGQNGLIREKYVTFSLHAENYQQAKEQLENRAADIADHFKRMGSSTRILSGIERLSLLQGIMRPNEEMSFYPSLFATHGRGLPLGNALGTFRHKQDSTLVAEQTTIFSVSIFLRVNI